MNNNYFQWPEQEPNSSCILISDSKHQSLSLIKASLPIIGCVAFLLLTFFSFSLSYGRENIKSEGNIAYTHAKKPSNSLRLRLNRQENLNTFLMFGFEEKATTISPLNLISMCSDTPSVRRRWMVYNPNAFSVAYTWKVFENIQAGSRTAAPGYSYFFTNRIGGPNTTLLY